MISFLEKYLRVINRINMTNYRNIIMKGLGNQFINLLIDHFSLIRYQKEGLTALFSDIANFKKIVSQINVEEVEKLYKNLRTLIDIYVIKNDEKTINDFIKD